MNIRIFQVCAMKCMCAQTRPRFILSSERVFWGMEFEPMLTPSEKSPLPENFPRAGSNSWRCGQRAQHYQRAILAPCSLLYLWGSPFWVRFWHMWPFFLNPSIQVVTFCLHGWCMLGVFLLPAFTHPGHEWQALLSPCDGMHGCTYKTSVYTLIRKSLGGMESETMLTPRENFHYWRLRGGSNPPLHHTGQRAPTHYQLSYSSPHVSQKQTILFPCHCQRERNRPKTIW